MYQAGMIFNDVADIEEDSKERPFRPIPSGKISKQQAVYLASGLMVAGNIVAGLYSSSLLIGSLMLSALILTYDFFAKSLWWRPFVMGAVRMQNWLLVAFAMSGLYIDFVMIALVIGIYTSMLTFVARDETSNLSEQSKHWLLWLLIVWFLVVLYLFVSNFSVLMAVFLGFALWIGLKLHQIMQGEKDNIQQEVMQLLKLMVVLDGAILVSFGHVVLGVACMALIFASSLVAKKVYMT